MKILNAILILSFFCTLARAQSPNILLVYLDDKAFATQDYSKQMPTLKSLEKEALKLENFYSPSAKNVAVELLLAKYLPNVKNLAIGADIEENEYCIAKDLKDLGYASAYIGKWCDAQNTMPSKLGFDSFYGILDSESFWPYDWQLKAALAGKLKANDVKNPSLSLMLNSNIIEFPAKPKDFLPKFTKEAMDFMESSLAQEKPFFIYLNYATSYTEEVAIQKFFPAQIKTKREAYYQNVDYNLAKILNDLEQSEALENTLIIFISHTDNGLKASENAKNLAPEAKHKLSAFIHYPKLFKEPKSLDGVICTIDMASAIVDCAKQAKGETSMLGYFLANHSCDDSPFLYYGLYKEPFAMRKGNLKVVLPKDQRKIAIQLYDLSKDPNELNNLAPSRQEEAEVLKKAAYALDYKQPKVLNAQDAAKKEKQLKEKAKELEKQKKKALKEAENKKKAFDEKEKKALKEAEKKAKELKEKQEKENSK